MGWGINFSRDTGYVWIFSRDTEFVLSGAPISITTLQDTNAKSHKTLKNSWWIEANHAKIVCHVTHSSCSVLPLLKLTNTQRSFSMTTRYSTDNTENLLLTEIIVFILFFWARLIIVVTLILTKFDNIVFTCYLRRQLSFSLNYKTV